MSGPPPFIKRRVAKAKLGPGRRSRSHRRLVPKSTISLGPITSATFSGSFSVSGGPLATGRYRRGPISFALAQTGLLMMSDGYGPVLRWDGLSPQAETAGVVAPTTAPILSAAGFGNLVGTYSAYVRFVDQYGNFSSLSPAATDYTVGGATGLVTDATNAAPIVIESTAHGLSTGATVKVENVAGNTGANGTFVITVVDADHFSLNKSVGTAAYLGAGDWISGQASITFSSVATSSEPKVVRRQILRNTDGEESVFYVDIDTTDLTSASFTTTQDDATLSAGIAVPLFDSNGAPLANAYGLPPGWKMVLAAHLSRMFAAVDLVYSEGSVALTFGSKTVQGIGTRWPTTFAGRYLWAIGGNQQYLIDSVDAVNQVLTLDTAFVGVTNPYAQYGIRPALGERRLVYFSQAGFPEGWLPSDALSLEEDADEITGLMPKGSFLYILERAHIYRLTFDTDPGTDGAVFLSTNRGCVNNRCWVVVDDNAYMLDYQGVHAFAGGAASQSVSDGIASVFNPTVTGQTYRINWQAQQWFHAIHFAPEHVIRWFVAFSGQDVPRHALCYNYREQRWWIEEWQEPIGGSCVGYLAGVPQQYLGGKNKRTLAYGVGSLDGANAQEGTVQSDVSSSTPDSLTDATAIYAADLVGVPVAITAGRGKGQVRQIVAVSGRTLRVDRPWAIQPDATASYQIGGIPWHYITGWFRFAESEDLEVRRIEVIFNTTATPATMDLRDRLDFNVNPVLFNQTMVSAQRNGIASTKGSPDLVCDLTKANGLVQIQLPGFRELYMDGRRFSQIELRGFGSQDPQAIYQLIYDGVMQTGL